MSERDVHAAVAAELASGGSAHAELLRSIVDVGRAIFQARACSVTLLDEESGELVFEAIAGEGSPDLLGARFPSSTGVAGWVLVARESIVVEDTGHDPRFARDVAERTGFVPERLMAAPLLRGDETIGVLEVLDWTSIDRPLAEIELLDMFGAQAAVALGLAERARRARRALDGSEELVAVAALATRLDGLTGERRKAGLRLLAALEQLLR